MEIDLVVFKQQVHEHYKQLITAKVDGLQQKLNDVINMTQNETKSSAGDKYETARAMLQIEQNLLRGQLSGALTQKAVFEKLNPLAASSVVSNGSLINTNQGFLYISVALGKATIHQRLVIALSAQSPLGVKLLGKRNKEVITFNGTDYLINSIT